MVLLKHLGTHVLAELYDCDFNNLNDEKLIEKVMVESALKTGATIIKVEFHKFSPQGVSGVVIIAESHLTIHTWPELNYAAVDVFTCGEKIDPKLACKYICQGLKANNMDVKVIKRGKNVQYSR